MTQPAVVDPPAEPVAPRRSRRWVRWAAAGVAVLLVVGGAVWWLGWSARVVGPGSDGGSFGIGVPARDRATFSFGGMMLCVSGASSATVERVEVDSGDALVTDFALRPPLPPDEDGIYWTYGSEPERLADSDFGTGRTIRGRCGTGNRTELAVELTRPGPGTARADGLLVHWSAGIRSGTTRVAAHLVLCTEPETSADGCRTIP